MISMVLIEVDTELISEHEKRHRATILDDLLGILNEHGEITMKKVNKIPVVNDEGEIEHWPFKVIDLGPKVEADPMDVSKFCEVMTKEISIDFKFAKWMLELIEAQLQYMFLKGRLCSKHVKILKEINPLWVEKQMGA